MVAGVPKTIEVTSEEIREALSEPLRMIIEGCDDGSGKNPSRIVCRYRR